MGVENYSKTPSENTATGDGTGVAEGMNAAAVNNAMRSIMADIAVFRDTVGFLKEGKTSKAFGYAATAADEGKWLNIDPNDPISPIAARLPAASTVSAGWSIVFDFEGNPLSFGKRLWSDADIVLDGVVQDWNGSQGMTVYSGMIIQLVYTGSDWFARILSSLKGVSGHVTNVLQVVIDLTPFIDGGWADFELRVSKFVPDTNNELLAGQVSTDGGATWLTSYRRGGNFTFGATNSAFDNTDTRLDLSPTTGNIKRARSTAYFARSPDNFASVVYAGSRDSTDAMVTQGVVCSEVDAAATHLRLFASSGDIAELRYSLLKIPRP